MLAAAALATFVTVTGAILTIEPASAQPPPSPAGPRSAPAQGNPYQRAPASFTLNGTPCTT